MSRKTILVTGASGGIGKQIIQHLADQGHKIIGCSRTNPMLDIVNFTYIPLDLDKSDHIEFFVRELSKKTKLLDAMVLTHGIAPSNLSFMSNSAEVEEVMRVNFCSTIDLINKCYRLLANSHNASVITLSTINVSYAATGTLAYSCSKSALEEATKILARELIGAKISVNCLRLSSVENIGMAVDGRTKRLDQVVASTVYRQPINIKSINNAIDFLLDSFSNMLTGQIITLGDL
jgi:3-oxoacyl-[acyl-carrier protein] reductase